MYNASWREGNGMKAVVYQNYGSPDVLELREVEKPVVKDDEVLVKIHAAAVTPFDWHFLTGSPFIVRLMAGLLKPRHTTLGTEVAGRIEETGVKVSRFKAGDEVFGHGNSCGGYAEYVCLPEASVLRKPEGVSFEEAAAVWLSALTSLTASAIWAR
jgi:NADPH:quinone reductase-like Zn-dependent oxidoreductase